MNNALRLIVVVAIVGILFFLVNESNFVENKFTSVGEVKAARPSARAGIPVLAGAEEVSWPAAQLDRWRQVARCI